jgi:NADH:ubiquinone oxidoreductase subunit D
LNRSIFQIWQPYVPKDETTFKKLKTMNLNVGPQHPAAHGVLRLVVQLNGEIVEKIDPHIGLLHRGTEKLMEDKIYLLSLPYFDRFDYVSMMIQEHAYCLAIESLLGTINYNATFVKIRTLYDEITRILNHMLAIACHALDVGSMSPIFWAFEEREKLMEFYERVSGARMHAAFYRPNEVNLRSISSFLLEDILDFSKNCFATLNEIHNTLTYNKIWKQRLVNVGTYSYEMCVNWGLTGVMARSTGIKRDIRLDNLETYANYYYLNFRSFIGQNGDSYDRFLLRMNEMSESLNIMNQIIYKLLKHRKPKKNIKKNSNINPHFTLKYLYPKSLNHNNYKSEYTSMEQLIHHFKYWSEGFPVKSGWTYKAVESPKGEFGVSLISDNTNIPYRCKVRSPAYHHLQVLPTISKGHFLADLVALMGTIDVVFGEIDR